ncbi:Hypothetical predicted protein [Paramuricea clavata]|uniref:Uncharacterized protein n=1 Tax=Paramuricea clavata TaxID=317549 RepID=A0A7D9DE80_PARCT|nr:Hypothetical predicted protein [Paramuricea clavata]
MARKSIGIAELDFENGSLAESWKQWKQTMKLTLQGPLAEKEEKQQCGYFLLYIGQKGRDIYNTWALKSAEIDKIDALFDRFEAFVILSRMSRCYATSLIREINEATRI